MRRDTVGRRRVRANRWIEVLLTLGALSVSVPTIGGCADVEPAEEEDTGVSDPENARFLAPGKADVEGIAEGSLEALGVLRIVNEEDAWVLSGRARLARDVSYAIHTYRVGPDWRRYSRDDNRIDTLAELDEIPFVGPNVFARLVTVAIQWGYVPAGMRMAGTPILVAPVATHPSIMRIGERNVLSYVATRDGGAAVSWSDGAESSVLVASPGSLDLRSYRGEVEQLRPRVYDFGDQWMVAACVPSDGWPYMCRMFRADGAGQPIEGSDIALYERPFSRRAGFPSIVGTTWGLTALFANNAQDSGIGYVRLMVLDESRRAWRDLGSPVLERNGVAGSPALGWIEETGSLIGAYFNAHGTSLTLEDFGGPVRRLKQRLHTGGVGSSADLLRGPNFFTMPDGSLVLIAGRRGYTLDRNGVAIAEHVLPAAGQVAWNGRDLGMAYVASGGVAHFTVIARWNAETRVLDFGTWDLLEIDTWTREVALGPSSRGFHVAWTTDETVVGRYDLYRAEVHYPPPRPAEL